LFIRYSQRARTIDPGRRLLHHDELRPGIFDKQREK
jgi:hypothetical protein